MKLSRAQSKWVKQLVEDSTSKERGELKRKEKPLRDLRQLWCLGVNRRRWSSGMG